MILRLETGKSTIPGVGCRVWWFPTAVRIRLSQPPAGLGLGLGLSLAIYEIKTNKLGLSSAKLSKA